VQFEATKGWHGILSTKIVRSGVLFTLFCTVNWLDVEGLDIELGS